jgi:hypothetical protein
MTGLHKVQSPARPRWRPIVILAATAVLAVLIFAGAPAVLRIPAAALLFLAAPGLAWTPVLGLHRDRLLAAMCVLTISIACAIAAAQAVMWVSGLQWEPVAWVLIVITVAGAGVQAKVRSRSW